MITTLAIFIGSILGLIITSAFFSGSETALTAVSKARIRHLADEGDSRAKEVEKLISKQDTLISTLLVGSNLVNILASVLATSLFISLFGEIGVVLATFVMTALVVIFAEILPKMIALENSDREWKMDSVERHSFYELSRKTYAVIAATSHCQIDKIISKIFCNNVAYKTIDTVFWSRSEKTASIRKYFVHTDI